jgi:hypothetical protein
LQHRLAGADRFDDRVGAEAIGEVLDPGRALSPRSPMMSVAPNSSASF